MVTKNYSTSVKEVILPKLNNAKVFAKCEYENPTGSHKDRVYEAIVKGLEKDNKIKQGDTLIDFSSGNGGAALAKIAKERGYNAKIVVPAKMSKEKIEKIKKYGAEIILVPTNAHYGYYGTDDLLKARLKAAQLAELKGYFFLDQANNPLNIEGCKEIGKELLFQLDDIEPDYFVCGIGTGGTLSGVSQILKERYNSLKVIGVEPAESNTIQSKLKRVIPKHGEHSLAGIGSGEMSASLDISLIEDVITVEEREWKKILEELNQRGYNVGKTSAANIAAIVKLLEKGFNGKFVTIFFDSFDNYRSEFQGNSTKVLEIELNKKISNYDKSWDILFNNPKFNLRVQHDSYLDYIIKDLKKRGIKCLASIACGDCVNEGYIQKLGITVEGYDISEEALKLAKQTFPTIKTENLDILKNNLPVNYDATLVFDFSMHLTDDALIKCLDNIYKSLNSNGFVYINFLSPDDDTAKMHELNSENVALLDNGIFIKYRTKEEIESIIQQTGFSIVEISDYERKDKPHVGFRENLNEHVHRGYYAVLGKNFATIDNVISHVKEGKPIIILDNRENEGDFFVASEKVTSKIINYFLQNGRGVLCVSMLLKRFKELKLPTAKERSMNENETLFGEPVDFMISTTTGVSAHDRSETIRAITNPSAEIYQFRRNGHVRTLEANENGLLSRQGHTEASVELAKMAGLYPSGALIEILNPDGTMARENELILVSKKEDIPIIKIGQIWRYLYGR